MYDVDVVVSKLEQWIVRIVVIVICSSDKFQKWF